MQRLLPTLSHKCPRQKERGEKESYVGAFVCVKREFFLVTLNRLEFVLANIRRFFRAGYRGKQIKDKKRCGLSLFPFAKFKKACRPFQRYLKLGYFLYILYA